MVMAMVVVYLVGTSLLSYFAYYKQKKSQNAADFMLNRKHMGVFMVIVTQIGVAMAGGSTLGVVADSFEIGISGGWLVYFQVIVHIIFAFFIVKFLLAMNKKFGAITWPGVFEQRFDGKVRIVMVITVSVFYLLLFSMQPAAAANILAPILGIDRTAMAWIAGLIFVAIVMLGGMKGIAWMNIVHSLVMALGLALLAIRGVNAAGGVKALTTELPSSYFSLAQPSLQFVIGNVIALVFGNLFNSLSLNITFGAKTAKTAKNGIFLASICIAGFSLLPVFIGLAAKVLFPEINPNLAFSAIASYFGPGMSGLVSMAVVAAIFSTAPSCLLIVSNSLTQDVFVKARPESTDKQRIAFSRIIILVGGVVAIILGVGAPTLTANAYSALQITSVSAVVLIMSLLWKRVNSRAAFFAMIAGSVIGAVWSFAGKPFGIAPFWPTIIVTLAILIPLTLASKNKISEGYARYAEARDEYKKASRADANARRKGAVQKESMEEA